MNEVVLYLKECHTEHQLDISKESMNNGPPFGRLLAQIQQESLNLSPQAYPNPDPKPNPQQY